jgi:hypothetical protein
VRLRWQEEKRGFGWSAEDHAFGGARRRGVCESHHPERVEEAEERGEERDQQRDLKREMSGVGVDADDLLLGRRRLSLQLLGERGVAHDLGVVLERL